MSRTATKTFNTKTVKMELKAISQQLAFLKSEITKCTSYKEVLQLRAEIKEVEMRIHEVRKELSTT